ncbi:hypothetical protein C7212DRAFT_352263 [Tuber magnatum]|uniref:Uncharacterized protein n=1 Tax=Tuber magnatum TaxID=42249 RepID=A0A317SRJ8_9PEZI|nr:hypothetical protein C7212DRAFT_352263 [Tuber magnatum]
MPQTPLDKMLTSKNAFLGFSPARLLPERPTELTDPSILSNGRSNLNVLGDPTGDPEEWTVGEMEVWLGRRGLETFGTREEVLERVRMRLRERE